MATGPSAGADDVDGRRFAAKAPQPGVESADAPAALVGVDDVTLPERFVEQLVGGPGKIRQTLLSANEGCRGQA
jgi:hypothetical protein